MTVTAEERLDHKSVSTSFQDRERLYFSPSISTKVIRDSRHNTISAVRKWLSASLKHEAAGDPPSQLETNHGIKLKVLQFIFELGQAIVSVALGQELIQR